MSGIKKMRSKEHVAWEILQSRVAYLNTFAGNRNEMLRITEMMETAWQKAIDQIGNIHDTPVDERGR